MNTYNAFTCIHCGYGQTKTNTTTKAKSGVDMRRSRSCPSCSRGFVTYEVTAADYAILQALRKWRPSDGTGEQCGCHKCIQERDEVAIHMVVCPTCGNKRCPKASNHELACTNSNEPGQTGSVEPGDGAQGK